MQDCKKLISRLHHIFQGDIFYPEKPCGLQLPDHLVWCLDGGGGAISILYHYELCSYFSSNLKRTKKI